MKFIPENKGNLVTRRAFAQRDGVPLRRIELLAEVTHKSGAMAYKMTEEVGIYGSGKPSPLYTLCELIRSLVNESDLTAAREMAAYPRIYLSELEAGHPTGDAVAQLGHLLKSVSDANYLLKGRAFEDLPLGELKQLSEAILVAMTAASDLELKIDALIQAKEQCYTGAPIESENLRHTG